MSLKNYKLRRLLDKHEALEAQLEVPSEVEVEEGKIKASKKPAPKK